jgi:hypothetical protein
MNCEKDENQTVVRRDEREAADHSFLRGALAGAACRQQGYVETLYGVLVVQCSSVDNVDCCLMGGY